MRRLRAASSLLSLFSKPKLSSQNTLPFLHSLPSTSRSDLKPPITFPKCPRLFQTLSQSTPPLESLKSQDKLLLAFKSLDSSSKVDSFSSNELVKALDLTIRALEIFERDEGGSISVAKALRLLGLISCKLKKFGDSLESLNTAVVILDRLEKEGFNDSEIRAVSLMVYLQLVETNSEMGRKWDTLTSLKRVFQLRKSIFDPNSPEMGAAYKDLCEAYAVVLDFKEALPLILKALEIFEVNYGCDSVEVARVRQLLSVIYVGLDENDKALEQIEFAKGIFTCLELEDDLLNLLVEEANIKISMGGFSEAIEILKSVIQRVGKESKIRAFVFVSMAKALCSQEKFGEAKRCLEIACGVLDKFESVDSSKVFDTYAEISMIYEIMNEFETALSLMERTLAMVSKSPREQHLEGSISARMGWLLLLTGRAERAIPYLERGEQRLKDSFGEMHFGLGFVSKHLGQAYMEVGRPAHAVQVLATAYNILSRWFGPKHEDSIDACQSLANAYATKASSSSIDTKQGHYASAMEFQQRVITAWESCGPNATDELREAHRLFEQLKKKALGSPSAVYPANALPLSQCR
ncbi:protein KINESIN LIGHT CHAIN-RELATED 1-like [Asparagus officinalis]|nr:protein KINESIN LIGHT CHAIN-RELATED 1-like [Asparagus officinalis]XP_020247995.1 protein KINESIN LIGHT CHAIN-RELATED 1-like [Asparagus officinalis]XP_020247996.1 protein KINESIN LIGHT CHAIN-RELATED 1-like [Asparagus officinalis]